MSLLALPVVVMNFCATDVVYPSCYARWIIIECAIRAYEKFQQCELEPVQICAVSMYSDCTALYLRASSVLLEIPNGWQERPRLH